MELRDWMIMALPIIGGLIWAIRQEGRLSAHERECIAVRDATAKLADERQRRMDERHDMYTLHFQNIDIKLDRLLDTSGAGRSEPRHTMPPKGER